MTLMDFALPLIGGFLTLFGQKILERFKTPSQSKIDDAEAKAKQIENDNSQLNYTKNLLDFAKGELDKAIDQIKRRDDVINAQDAHIQDLNAKLKDSNIKFDELTEKVKHTFSEIYQWKMHLEKETGRHVVTSSEINIESLSCELSME